jgi:hypothetical protein
MEHLQAQVERTGGKVNTPQEVIDALVSSTQGTCSKVYRF